MRRIAPVILLLLAACSSKAADFEKEYYQLAAKTRLEHDRWPKLCAKARALEQMYRDENNMDKFGEWAAQADTNCAQRSSLLP